jgi:hypothetical protein
LYVVKEERLLSYILVAITVTGILGYLSLANRFESFRSNKQDFYHLIISLLASFVGIFMAINLESFESERKEIDQVVGLVTVARDGAEREGQNINTLMNILQTYESDEAAKNDEINHYNDNPIYLPSFFESIITNDLVMTKISPKTYGAVATSYNTMKWLIDSYNDKDETFEKRSDYLLVLNKEFDYTFGVLDSEIKYLNGEISKDELEELLEFFLYEKLGISEQELQNQINDALDNK